jgi:WD40 repeat protein
VALTSAAHLVASAGSDGTIILWNLPSATILHTLTSGTIVRALVFSNDARSLISVGDDGAVQVWEPGTGKAGAKWQASGDWLLAVSLSPDGKTVATGGLDGKLRLWELAGGKMLIDVPAQVPAPPNQPVNSPAAIASLAFAPDGKSIMAGGQDGLIYHFGLDGKLIRTLTGHGSTVTGLAFHPTGTVLVSSSKDRTVRLWTPANGQPVKLLEGHTAWVMGVTFAAHGTRLASVSADHSVRIWDLSEPGKK